MTLIESKDSSRILVFVGQSGAGKTTITVSRLRYIGNTSKLEF